MTKARKLAARGEGAYTEDRRQDRHSGSQQKGGIFGCDASPRARPGWGGESTIAAFDTCMILPAMATTVHSQREFTVRAIVGRVGFGLTNQGEGR